MYFQQNYYNSTSLSDRLKDFYRRNKVLSYIIIANITLWFIVFFTNFIIEGYNSVAPISAIHKTSKLVDWLALPASLSALIRRPWSIISYFFLHQRFTHILFNMLILYFAGTLFNMFIKQRKLVNAYFIGGIVGGVFFVVAYNIFPALEQQSSYAMAVGASAAVFSVMMTAASYMPNMQFRLFFSIVLKLKYIALLFIVLDLFNIRDGNIGGNIAHIGGILYGLSYGYYLREKNRIKSFNIIKKIKNYFIDIKENRQNKKRQKKVEQERQVKLKQEAQKQQQINNILEKISRAGYASLTQAEKDFLFTNNK